MAINVEDYVGIGIDPNTGARHEIKYLPSTAEWEDGVYQLEQKDKLIGGIDGISNVQAQALANRTEYLKQVIEEKIGSAATYEITIPTTGWIENLGGYPYRLDITIIESITTGMIPILTIHPADLAEATTAGMCPVCETIDGGLRVYSKAVPTAAIAASLTVITPGGGGGSGTLPIATESSLGAVKIGDGLTVQTDGTLSVNQTKVMTDGDLVDEEEAKREIIEDFESNNDAE